MMLTSQNLVVIDVSDVALGGLVGFQPLPLQDKAGADGAVQFHIAALDGEGEAVTLSKDFWRLVVGAAKLKELTKRTTFIRVQEQENNVFGKE